MLGNQVNTEHLMLGILHCNNKQVNDIFEHFGINTDVLRSTLYDSQEQAIDKISAEEIAETEEGRALKYDKETSEVISEAIIEARLCEGKAALVQPEHLLLAILKKDECDPAKLLITQGLTYKKLFDYINGINLDIDNKLNKLNQEVENYKRNQIDGDSEQEAVDEKPETETAPEQEQESAEGDINMIDLRDKQQLPENQEEADTSTLPDGAASAQDNQGDLLDPEEEPLDFSENQNSGNGKQGGNNGKHTRNVVGTKPTKSNTPFLDKFSYDLTKAAKDGSLDPVVGRDKEITRLMEILGRRKKNNPVLIGEPGVGKSAIVEGLAQMIAKGDQSSLFFNKRVLSLDMTGIVAGTKYRRQVEGEMRSGVRMMLTGQVFSIMAGTATDEQIRQITKSADRYLYDEKVGGYRLNTDFGEVKTDLGRMFGFSYGDKENGAVFSHMAVMYANALYKRGFAKEGYKSLHALYRQSANFEVSRIYPGIPEYFNGRGRGMYHYLTGAASWYMLTVITEMFGVRGRIGDMILEPKLLKEQFDEEKKASLTLQFADKNWKITYLNREEKDYGEYQIADVTVDGEKINFVPKQHDQPISHNDDQGRHETSGDPAAFEFWQADDRQHTQNITDGVVKQHP